MRSLGLLSDGVELFVVGCILGEGAYERTAITGTHRGESPDLRGQADYSRFENGRRACLGMLAAGDTPETILKEYSFLERDDIQACLLFAHRSLSGDHVHDRMPLTKSA